MTMSFIFVVFLFRTLQTLNISLYTHLYTYYCDVLSVFVTTNLRLSRTVGFTVRSQLLTLHRFNVSQQAAQAPMQQAQAEPSKLISRAGGKNVITQLSKGDSEIVQEVTVAGEKKQIPLMAYAAAQTRALFYQALFEINKDAKPSPQLVVLNDTGKIFLDPKYQPQLLQAECGQMTETQTAQNVDLKAYRANLVTMRDDYTKRGMKVHQECVDTLLTALDKKQLLTLAQVQQVYDVIGDEVVVPKAQVRPVMDNLVKKGAMTPQDAAEMDGKIQGDTKLGDLAKQSPEMIVGANGKVISKRKIETGGTKTGSYRKWPEPKAALYTPMSNRMLKGVACGSSRPPQQMYYLERGEVGISVNLEEETLPRPKTTLKK